MKIYSLLKLFRFVLKLNYIENYTIWMNNDIIIQMLLFLILESY